MAHRMTSARLDAIPAVMRASTVARSAGPSEARTTADPSTSSTASKRNPRSMLGKPYRAPRWARRAGVSGMKWTHATDGSSPA